MNVWGFHSGKWGDADRLFFSHESCIAIGWAKIPDLREIADDRERIKAADALAYPEKTKGTVTADAGFIYAFLNTLAIQDIVVFSSWEDHRLHFAQVTGNYYYNQEIELMYPHRRKVKWLLRSVPRSDFSELELRRGVDKRGSTFRIYEPVCNAYLRKIPHLL
jgi:predicted Mrr-cat superfamily restriction endonuclease